MKRDYADVSEKSVEFMSLICETGTRTEFSGHAHGQIQSRGCSGMQGVLVR